MGEEGRVLTQLDRGKSGRLLSGGVASPETCKGSKSLLGKERRKRHSRLDKIK